LVSGAPSEASMHAGVYCNNKCKKFLNLEKKKKLGRVGRVEKKGGRISSGGLGKDACLAGNITVM